MLQLIFLLLFSRLILVYIAKVNTSVLGFYPTKNRLNYFMLFFSIAALASLLHFLLRVFLLGEVYVPASNLGVSSVFIELWNHFRSVLTEELMFRGALLYVLYQRFGTKTAILLSSIGFSLMHFSFQSANLIQLMLELVFTFLMGLLLAYAFFKTKSILVPFGIHLGWNLVQNFVFSGSFSGKHLFVLLEPTPEVTLSYFSFFILILAPKLLVLGINWFVLKSVKVNSEIA